MEAHNIEHIGLFLAQEISLTELSRRLPHLSNEQLEEEINIMKDIELAIEAEGLKDHLTKLFSEKKPKSKYNIKSIVLSFAVAASLLIMASILLFKSDKSMEKLYAKYEFKDPGIPITMSTTDQYELYDALSYYSEGNYQEALSRLNLIQENAQANDTLNYFSGLCLLYLNKAQEAQPLLNSVSNNDSSSFQQRADWTLVLTNLKLKNKNAVLQIISKITSNRDHMFYEDAISLEYALK